METQLALTVGPIAKVLVRNLARKSTEWPALVAALAEHIEHRHEREAFVKFCQVIRH